MHDSKFAPRRQSKVQRSLCQTVFESHTIQQHPWACIIFPALNPDCVSASASTSASASEPVQFSSTVRASKIQEKRPTLRYVHHDGGFSWGSRGSGAARRKGLPVRYVTFLNNQPLKPICGTTINAPSPWSWSRFCLGFVRVRIYTELAEATSESESPRVVHVAVNIIKGRQLRFSKSAWGLGIYYLHFPTYTPPRLPNLTPPYSTCPAQPSPSLRPPLSPHAHTRLIKTSFSFKLSREFKDEFMRPIAVGSRCTFVNENKVQGYSHSTLHMPCRLLLLVGR